MKEGVNGTRVVSNRHFLRIYTVYIYTYLHISSPDLATVEPWSVKYNPISEKLFVRNRCRCTSYEKTTKINWVKGERDRNIKSHLRNIGIINDKGTIKLALIRPNNTKGNFIKVNNSNLKEYTLP